MNSGMIEGIAGMADVPKVDEKTAHLAVYGKMMYDSDGNLLDDDRKYPECASTYFSTNTFDKSELKDKIVNMKIQVKESIKGLCVKKAELTDATQKAGIEIVLGASSFIDAATNVPKPQPSLALSSILGILSSVTKLQSKVLEIVPFLAPLKYLSVLLPSNSVDTVIGLVNVILSILFTLMTTIETVTVKPLEPIMSLIPSSQSDIDKVVKTSMSGTVNGTISDGVTGQPIGGAGVKIGTKYTVTNNSGFYSIDKVDGGTTSKPVTADITVTASNYKTATVTTPVESGKTTKKDIALYK